MLTDTIAHFESDDGLIDHWTLRSPARLHFGLIEICPGEPNLFGGLGVTIDEPATQIQVASVAIASGANVPWRIDSVGPWQDRIDPVLKRLYAEIAKVGVNENDFYVQGRQTIIRVEQPPEAHVGLGSGTQIACSAATAFASRYVRKLSENSTLTASDVWDTLGLARHQSAITKLAEVTGRGVRSQVGLAGHLLGGLIVDHGIQDASIPTRIVERTSVPASWHAVLVRPCTSTTVSGARELDYFSQCASPNANRSSMLRLIHEEIVPSMGLADLARFGEALYQYGRYAGEVFRTVQGGLYRDQDVANLIEAIRKQGISATGQTSWGPTVYAIVDDMDQAKRLEFDLNKVYQSSISIRIARLTNHPAEIHVSSRLGSR